MLIYFQEIIFTIIMAILKMIQGLIEISNSILGIEPINYNNEEITLLEYFINNVKVNNIFWTIFIITIFLCSIFVIVSIVKNIINYKENLLSIIGKYILSLLSILIVLVIIFIIVIITNIFVDIILNLFNVNISMNISKDILNYSINNWLNDYSINEINIFSTTTREILGNYKSESYLLFPNEWQLNGMTNPNEFLYLPCIITSIIVLISLIYCAIKIIKRMYEIVFLYLIMPIAVAMIPMDKGNRFKIWIEQFVKKIALIFIVIISMQLFMIITPIFLKMELNYNISQYGKSIYKLCIISSGALINISAVSIFNKIITNNNVKEILNINKRVLITNYKSEANNENNT